MKKVMRSCGFYIFPQKLKSLVKFIFSEILDFSQTQVDG